MNPACQRPSRRLTRASLTAGTGVRAASVSQQTDMFELRRHTSPGPPGVVRPISQLGVVIGWLSTAEPAGHSCAVRGCRPRSLLAICLAHAAVFWAASDGVTHPSQHRVASTSVSPISGRVTAAGSAAETSPATTRNVPLAGGLAQQSVTLSGGRTATRPAEFVPTLAVGCRTAGGWLGVATGIYYVSCDHSARSDVDAADS